jgi:hypothetical protein
MWPHLEWLKCPEAVTLEAFAGIFPVSAAGIRVTRNTIMSQEAYRSDRVSSFE